MIAWNARRFLKNNYLLFIGIAYLFVGGLDLIHTLAYTGMGVFKGYETNLPTQLWIAARYMQGISLLIAPLLFRRKLKVNLVFLGYALVTFIMLLSIFYWDIFPLCFIEGAGLTPFKKISEYIISLILLGSIALLLKKRNEFDRVVLQLMLWSILSFIVSELGFTFYVQAYGFPNLIGHYFKILSFYFIYKAIIEIGLRRPYDLLSRDLRQREETLRRSRDELETRVQERTAELEKTNEELQAEINERKQAEETVKAERQRLDDVLEMLPAYVVLLTPDYHVPFANRFFRERFGESHGRRCFEYLFGRREPCEICETYTVLKTNAFHHWEWTGPDGRIYDIYDFPFTDTDGSPLIMEMGIDITERKRAEEALRTAHQYNRSLIEASIDPLVTISADGKIMDANRATELVTGVSCDHIIGSDFSDYFTEPEKAREGYKRVFSEGSIKDYPLAIRHTSGKVTDVLYHATVFRNEAGEIQGIFAAARDITVRKGLQRRIEATNDLLNFFIRMRTRKDYLDRVLGLIQNWCGCRCVGIRVLDGRGNIPYESYSGFSRKFWESENFLSLRNDQCVCIRVITGQVDPQDAPVVTPAGSFCCGNTVKFIRQLSEEEKRRYRGVCVGNGFLSVAVIPIRYGEEILGAIHLADETQNRVSFKSLEFIESVVPLIGEAIQRFNLEEELKDSENRLRLLSSQLLTVQENERKRISREIHDSIGQSLTAIKFRVENVIEQMGKSRVEKMAKPLEALIPIIQEAVEETRRIQMDLRPSILDDLGILATVRWFCREFQTTFPSVRIETQMDIQEDEVSASLKTVIFRIMQEALNNIAKHSKADFVSLSLKKIDGAIELAVQDNGEGFNLKEVLSQESPGRGLGLTSMRERTELSGGSFWIESTIGKGTTIRASWTIS